MKRSFWKNLKAVSPVMATIIIVAIAIVMAIAVAYWMLGLGGAFTRFEKLEFASGYASRDDVNLEFDLHLKLKNTGSAALTIDDIFINGIPWSDVGAEGLSENVIDETLEPGEELATGLIVLDEGTSYVSGMSVELLLRTVGGKDYPKVIVLP
jgi:hypothetical protein